MASPTPEPEYQAVNEALRRALASMESHPPSYEAMGEEALRHVLVTALEAAFGASTSAEALRGNGKTDILLRIDGRVVYVGECKVWAGQAALWDALDQMLGYGTWRDHGLGLVVFVRGKHFRRTLERARAAIEKHAGFRRWLGELADATGANAPVASFAQRADPDAEANVAVQFAHLPKTRGERIGGGVDDIDQGLDVLLGLRRESLRTTTEHGIAYRASMGTISVPLAPEPGSMMRVERLGPEGRVAVDAVPLDDDAARRYAPTGAIEFDDGDAGDRARTLIEEAQRWGAEVEVVGGFGIRLDRYPPGMHQAVERLKQDSDLRMVLRPSHRGAWPIELRVASDRGDATIPMRLRIVDTPPDGWDLALRGHFRNLSLTYALTRADNDQPQQHEVSWAVHPTDASVRDRLAALDLLYAMSGAGTLRIQSCDRELPSMTIDLADCPLDAETLFERAFFTDLATLEDWSERQFELPEVASADQIQIVAAIATAIRTGGWHTTWERLTFSSPAEVPAKLDDWTAEDFPLPLEAEIFGEWVRFGFGRATIHFDIESIDPDPGDSTQRLLTVVPHGVGEHVVQVRGLEHVVLPLVAADESRPADHGGAR